MTKAEILEVLKDIRITGSGVQSSLLDILMERVGRDVQAEIDEETSSFLEEWKPINGYEGLYEISNRGRVKSLWNGKEKIRTILDDEDGDYIVLHKRHEIADLVKEAFGEEVKKPTIDQMDIDLFGEDLEMP